MEKGFSVLYVSVCTFEFERGIEIERHGGMEWAKKHYIDTHTNTLRDRKPYKNGSGKRIGQRKKKQNSENYSKSDQWRTDNIHSLLFPSKIRSSESFKSFFP